MVRRALLITYPDRFALEEASELAEAAGYRVERVLTQRFLHRAKYGVGSGKADEAQSIVKELGLEVVLFDERLRSVQIYNLAKLLGVEIIDRDKLILEIFYRRASTAEAKLQVQLAELSYEMPRAREKVRLAKMGEQPGFYGLGGYEVDVYYREIRRRVMALKRKLGETGRREELHRVQRRRLHMPTVCLAGYTGVGKTTLFNLLTGERKDAAKGAFTTLSTSTRVITLSGSKVLVSDTVGFISRLPAYVIEAFKATLQELVYANLVLLLVDVGERVEDMVRKYESCVRILSELGVSPSCVLLVFNKADLASEEDIRRKFDALEASSERSVLVSAKNGFGVDFLKERMRELVFEYAESTVLLSGEEVRVVADELDWLKENAVVELMELPEGGFQAVVKGPSWVIERFWAACGNVMERREN